MADGISLQDKAELLFGSVDVDEKGIVSVQRIRAVLDGYGLGGPKVERLLERLNDVAKDGVLDRATFMQVSEETVFRDAFEDAGADGEADLEQEVMQIFDTMTKSSGKMPCKDLPEFIRNLGTDDIIIIETVRVSLVERSIGGETGYLTDDAVRGAFKEDVFKDIFYNPDDVEDVINFSQPKVRFTTDATEMDADSTEVPGSDASTSRLQRGSTRRRKSRGSDDGGFERGGKIGSMRGNPWKRVRSINQSRRKKSLRNARKDDVFSSTPSTPVSHLRSGSITDSKRTYLEKLFALATRGQSTMNYVYFGALLGDPSINDTLPKTVSEELVENIFMLLDSDHNKQLNFAEFYDAFKDMFDDSGAVMRNESNDFLSASRKALAAEVDRMHERLDSEKQSYNQERRQFLQNSETAKEMQLQFEEQDREKEARIQELTQEIKQLRKQAEHAMMSPAKKSRRLPSIHSRKHDSSGEVDDLKRRVASLTNQIETLESSAANDRRTYLFEIEQLTSTCTDLEHKNEVLNDRLELIPALQDKIAEQQHDIDVLEDRLHETRQRMSAATIGSNMSADEESYELKFGAAEQTIREQSSKIKSLHGELKTTRSALQDADNKLEKERAQWKARIAELEQLLAHNSQALSDREAAASEHDDKVAGLKRQVHDLTENLGETTRVKNKLQAKVDKLREVEATLAERDAELAALGTQLRGATSRSSEEVSRLESKVESLVAEMNALQNQLRAAKATQSEADDTIRRLKSQIDVAKQNALNDSRTTADEQHEMEARLQGQIDKHLASLSSKDAALAALESDVAALRTSLKEAQRRIREEESRCASALSQEQHTAHRYNELTRAADVARKQLEEQIAGLEEELHIVRAELAEKRAECTVIPGLYEQLEAGKRRESELQVVLNEIKASSPAITQLKWRLGSANSKVSVLEGRLAKQKQLNKSDLQKHNEREQESARNIQSLEDEIRRMQASKDAVEREHATAVSVLEEEIAQLQSQLATVRTSTPQRTTTADPAELRMTKRRVMELETQVAHLTREKDAVLKQMQQQLQATLASFMSSVGTVQQLRAKLHDRTSAILTACSDASPVR
eukprot:m.862778 g.862778  ORF g.862778 m.862778 type:complete len:1088 (-) comp23536_c1_seq17:3256-6519(-)